MPRPQPVDEYQIWDFVQNSLTYPVSTLLDLEWTALRLGGRLGIGQGKQADNLNALDEVPNSAWFTNRHFLHPMSPAALAEGPGDAQPDTTGLWRVVAGKTLGLTKGFTVIDPKGQRYVLKFEAPDWPEMATSAEAIATRIFHAAGYNVPRNSVVFFHPGRLVMDENASLHFPDGTRRAMTREDLDGILAAVVPLPDGRLRSLASAFLDGEPLGPPGFQGRRGDDPNDRVLHEHRRELRGMRVISSWMHDTDRRTANMLDMYVTGAQGNRYVKHYVLDFGTTLGSNNASAHMPRYGNEYLWDPGNILRSAVKLGFETKRWDTPVPIKYRSIGYLENRTFRPGEWVTSFPNAAFIWRTDRDGYWGAKIVMAFTDEDIAAVVRTGKLSDPGAEAELTRLLIERRDMIGRYWFGRVNPLDRFRVEAGHLRFDDLAVLGGLENAEESRYLVDLGKEGRGGRTYRQVLDGVTRLAIEGRESHGYYVCDLRTQRLRQSGWSDRTRVRFYMDRDGSGHVLAIERQD